MPWKSRSKATRQSRQSEKNRISYGTLQAAVILKINDDVKSSYAQHAKHVTTEAAPKSKHNSTLSTLNCVEVRRLKDRHAGKPDEHWKVNLKTKHRCWRRVQINRSVDCESHHSFSRGSKAYINFSGNNANFLPDFFIISYPLHSQIVFGTMNTLRKPSYSRLNQHSNEQNINANSCVVYVVWVQFH